MMTARQGSPQTPLTIQTVWQPVVALRHAPRKRQTSIVCFLSIADPAPSLLCAQPTDLGTRIPSFGLTGSCFAIKDGQCPSTHRLHLLCGVRGGSLIGDWFPVDLADHLPIQTAQQHLSSPRYGDCDLRYHAFELPLLWSLSPARRNGSSGCQRDDGDLRCSGFLYLFRNPFICLLGHAHVVLRCSDSLQRDGSLSRQMD